MSAANPFNPRLVFGLIAAGILAFAALVLLLAFGGAPQSPGGREGRAHALSVSATGFKGLVDLVGNFREAYTIEAPEDFATEDLVVVAVEPRSRRADLSRLLAARPGRATLIILPKWVTIRDPARRGWVRALAPAAGTAAENVLDVAVQVAIRNRPPMATAVGRDSLDGLKVPIPDSPQVISGETLTPMLTLPDGGMLAARMGDQPHYLIADPDLLNNHGLRDAASARAALALIDTLNAADAEGVAFDLTVNGLGNARPQRAGLLRTIFEPPFLVMTLALIAAALLAGLHGAVRFGQTRREERAIPLGKAALVENSAGLIRLARREARLGGAYAEVVRHEVSRSTGAPPALAGEALDSYLDRLSRGDGPTFSALAARLAQARDRHELVAAARALFSWKKDLIR
ncbi:MAG TPA: hypothetical protein VJS15_01840 [Allosphingosinicella sp.]|nr:hypothetical protein [Allosphingosinicella sp.]